MARTMLCNPQNPPPRRTRSSASVAALAPAPSRKTRTTPEERKLWLQGHEFIEPSSVKANSVLCRRCSRIIRLDNRYQYHLDAWHRHLPRCSGLTGRKPRKQGSTVSSAKKDAIGAREEDEETDNENQDKNLAMELAFGSQAPHRSDRVPFKMLQVEPSRMEKDERVSEPSENPLPSSQLRYYGWEDFEEYLSERGRRERSCSLPISYVRGT